MQIDWVFLEEAERGEVNVGDMISAEAGGMPTYRVLALRDGRAWLRDEVRGADLISPLSRFHWKAARVAS
jgi:hypothetical protein